MHFLDYYKKYITSFYPISEETKNQLGFFLLRNITVAGIFIGNQEENEFMYRTRLHPSTIQKF